MTYEYNPYTLGMNNSDHNSVTENSDDINSKEVEDETNNRNIVNMDFSNRLECEQESQTCAEQSEFIHKNY